MLKIKFGLKLWSTNSDLVDRVEELIENDIFQYIELTPIPDTEIKPFQESDAPYVVHITTESHGVNIADKTKKEFNLRTINNCIEWADKLNAKYLVLHPGFGLMDDAIEFLRNIDDPRILIESMPKIGLDNEDMIGYTPEQIEKLMGNNFGFCLDFGHAIKASVSLKRNYKEFLPEFMGLKPAMFHLSDGRIENEKDEHLSFGEGNFDLKFLMGLIPKDTSRMITIETPRRHDRLDEDTENINYLKSTFL
jgi:endonuclease IV